MLHIRMASRHFTLLKSTLQHALANSTATMLKVHLKFSKTDQWGKGADIFLGSTGCSSCLVSGALTYMSPRWFPWTIFQTTEWSAPNQIIFLQQIWTALQLLGFPYQNFAGHSFRIGVATAAAKAGIEDSTIQAMGCWSSGAFLTYVY